MSGIKLKEPFPLPVFQVSTDGVEKGMNFYSFFLLGGKTTLTD